MSAETGEDVVNMSHTTFEYKKRDALSTISQRSERLQKWSSPNNSIPDSAEKVNSETKLSRKSSSEKQTSPVLERMERESIADFFLRSAVNEERPLYLRRMK